MKKSLLYLILLIVIYNSFEIKAKSVGNVLMANDLAVRYTGRTLGLQDGSISFDWAGVYFETRLSGGKLDAKISETGVSYYNIFVDGNLHKIVKLCGKDTVINLVSGIDTGIHSIKVQKRSEGEYGKTTLHQFLLPCNGYLKEEIKTRTRHIEFIGNSLTSGYGTDGKNREDPFLVETENCNKTFATISARYFDADYTLISHSGKGVVKNYGDTLRVSKNTMKDRMLNTFDENSTIGWSFRGYRPDLVVINLGSNDFSGEPIPFQSEFITAYSQIIKQVREHYGSVHIICLYPVYINYPVYSYYEALVEKLSDPNVHLLKFKDGLYNQTSDLGAGWHPGHHGHLKMAMWLIPYISNVTGWQLTGNVIW